MQRVSYLLHSTPLRQPINTFRSRPAKLQSWNPYKPFSIVAQAQKESAAQNKAKELNQRGLDDQEKEFKNGEFHMQIDNAIGQHKELQSRTPWHREGSDKPPVKRLRSASAMTKGS